MTERAFFKVKVETLTEAAQAAFKASREAYQASVAAKEAAHRIAEEAFPALPPGLTYKWYYSRFGISVEVVEAKVSEPKVATPKQSLAEFVANAVANGHSV